MSCFVNNSSNISNNNKVVITDSISSSREEEEGDSVDDDIEEDHVDSGTWKTRVLSQYPNVLLVRADLIDFWTLCYTHQKNHHHPPFPPIVKHYLLYPNPYPKRSRVKHRWYAHPSFPLLLQLGASDLIVRSNWKLYLEEFMASVHYTSEYLQISEPGVDNFAARYVSLEGNAVQRIDTTSGFQSMTNFEQKYVETGESIYELHLTYQKNV